jgi:hypothetical protein
VSDLRVRRRGATGEYAAGWTRVAARCFVGRDRVVDRGEPLGGGEVRLLMLLEGGEQRVQVCSLQARLRTRLHALLRLRAFRSHGGAGRRRRRRGAKLEEQRRVCRHALCRREAVWGKGRARIRWERSSAMWSSRRCTCHAACTCSVHMQRAHAACTCSVHAGRVQGVCTLLEEAARGVVGSVADSKLLAG